MSKKTGLSFRDVTVSLALIAVLVVVLMPIMRNWGRPPGCRVSTCQSNMSQIGRAYKMYLGDWNETFPPNRVRLKNGELGPIGDHVKLAALPGSIPNAGDKYKYGINWVEGLYGYIETASGSTDVPAVWQCPRASDETYPLGSKTAFTSYVFNRNLIEKSEDVVKNAANLMIVREVDRLVNADLRPVNDSTGSPDKPPICPFLNSSDVRMGKTQDQLHGNGSHILFVDGHVKKFDTSYMSNTPQWDPETKQWYNSLTSTYSSFNKAIAITP